MRKNLRSGYTQSYNPEAGVDTEGSQLIVGNRISQSAGDRAELEPGIESIDERTGKPELQSEKTAQPDKNPKPLRKAVKPAKSINRRQKSHPMAETRRDTSESKQSSNSKMK